MTLGEMRAGFARAGALGGVALADGDVAALFEALDRDGSGAVDVGEMVASFRALAAAEKKKKKKQEKTQQGKKPKGDRGTPGSFVEPGLEDDEEDDDDFDEGHVRPYSSPSGGGRSRERVVSKRSQKPAEIFAE